MLGAPMLDADVVSVAFEYQGVRDAGSNWPVLAYVQSDDDPAYVYICAANRKAWRAKRKPPAKQLQSIADRNFQGCVHHEFSDLVDAHSVPSDTCAGATARAKRKQTEVRLGPTIRFVAAKGPVTAADIRALLRASNVPCKLHELSTKITTVTEKAIRITDPKKTSQDPNAVTLTVFPRAVSVSRSKRTSAELLRGVVHALAKMRQLASIESGPEALRAADVERWLKSQ